MRGVHVVLRSHSHQLTAVTVTGTTRRLDFVRNARYTVASAVSFTTVELYARKVESLLSLRRLRKDARACVE